MALSSTGGNDLYTYWYAGHFLREDKDFYKSFINGELPEVPVHYLDRNVKYLEGLLFPDLVPAPASTSPIFFLLLPLAYLSWKTARLVWLLINLIFLLLLPFLVVRLYATRTWLSRWEFIAFACVLLGLTSTRYTISSGQLTFLMLDLMLASILLAEKKPWLAGVLLGMALSKYSLAIPIFILFLVFEPRLRMLLAAVITQTAGVLLLATISGSNFFEIINEYLRMALWHAGREGIHLAAAVTTLTGLQAGRIVFLSALLLTIAVAAPLIVWYRRKYLHGFFHVLNQLTRTHLAVILLLWILLAVYHRAYDTVTSFLFIGLIVYLYKSPASWDLGNRINPWNCGFHRNLHRVSINPLWQPCSRSAAREPGRWLEPGSQPSDHPAIIMFPVHRHGHPVPGEGSKIKPYEDLVSTQP